MRVVAVGRSGQLARSLLERGSSCDAQVVALGRPALDLARPTTVREALTDAAGDVIVNAAAYTAVDQAESEPDLAHLINAEGAATVAQTARELGVPLIHISTDYVFDGRKPAPYIETDPVAPINHYGESKLAAEVAVRAITPRHAIVRTAWVCSPFGSNFVKTMLRLAADRDVVRVVADQTGSPTSALDLADAVLELAKRLIVAREGDAGFGTFHAAGAGVANWADVATCVFEVAKQRSGPTARVERITTQDYPTPAARPANSQLDCSALFQTHGIRLPHYVPAIAETVARLLEPGSNGQEDT